MVSPSSRRATKRRRSSTAEHSFQGIPTSRANRRKCYPCVRYEVSPMSRAAHKGQSRCSRSDDPLLTQAGDLPGTEAEPRAEYVFDVLAEQR